MTLWEETLLLTVANLYGVKVLMSPGRLVEEIVRIGAIRNKELTTKNRFRWYRPCRAK